MNVSSQDLFQIIGAQQVEIITLRQLLQQQALQPKPVVPPTDAVAVIPPDANPVPYAVE